MEQSTLNNESKELTAHPHGIGHPAPALPIKLNTEQSTFNEREEILLVAKKEREKKY